MKQLLKNMRDGKTLVADVPVPSVRPGMVLVKTAASLVSVGTERMVVEFAEKNLVEKAQSRPDLVRQTIDKARREGVISTIDAVFNRLDQPMALGYSAAGTIVEIGEGIRGYNIGDRVACAGGGFAVHAEYIVVPQNLLAHLPDTVDFESAAFATLGAIALQGFRLAQPQVGERIAIIGLGLLGLLSVGIARAAGCEVFGIDLDPDRVKLAQKLGAQGVTRTGAEDAAHSFARGKGFDAVLICADAASNDPIELAGIIARDRGVVVAVGAIGMDIPRKIYYEKELQLLISRSYGPGRYDPVYEEKGQDYPFGYVRWTEGRNIQAIVDLLGAGKMEVKTLISHRFPIAAADQAYELISGKMNERFLGVIIDYPQDPTRIASKRIDFPQSRAVSPQTNDVLLGVLGAGNYATATFLPAVQRARVSTNVGIASGAGLSARNAAQKFGFQFASSDEREILDNERINLVAVLTRHNHHARQVVAALKNHKSVFCEKPLAIIPEELSAVEELISAAETPLLTVGYNRRYAPFSQKMFSFFRNRSEPMMIHYRINAGYLPDSHWLHDQQVGGGRILGEGCHFIDYLIFMVGEVPQTVHTTGLPNGGRYHDDNVVMTFSFPDGSIGTVTYLANGDKSVPKEYVEVFSGGKVAVLNDYRSLQLFQGGNREVLNARLRQDKGHQAGWESFVKAVQSAGPPPIPYSELIGGMKSTFAAIRSLQTKLIQHID